MWESFGVQRVLPRHCFTCCVAAKGRMHSPPSNDTSSMSDVTEILCAVSSGDFEGAASSLEESDFVSTSFGMAGTSGTGESALPSWAVEADDVGRLRRERDDRGRSGCASGRGVISDASSKLSCRNANQRVLVCLCVARGGVLTPDASEPSELVGRLSVSCALAGSAMVVLRDARYSSPRAWPSMPQKRRVPGRRWVGSAGVRARASSGAQGRHGRWGTCEREVNGNMEVN
jgi:hypothetical protein